MQTLADGAVTITDSRGQEFVVHVCGCKPDKQAIFIIEKTSSKELTLRWSIDLKKE